MLANVCLNVPKQHGGSNLAKPHGGFETAININEDFKFIIYQQDSVSTGIHPGLAFE